MRLPDVTTFQKMCSWWKVNPAEILDLPTEMKTTSTDPLVAAVHLRADQTLPEGAASDLAQLIVVAHGELARRAEAKSEPRGENKANLRVTVMAQFGRNCPSVIEKKRASL
jgi:hypothetical protein